MEDNVYVFLEGKNEAISEKDQLLTNHLVIPKSNETLDSVLRKFNGSKILAAPVCFPNGNYRMLSVMDILNCITDIGADLAFSLPISEICNCSGEIDYKSIPQDKPFKEAIQLLENVHRVLVINDDGIPINIITQMDIMNWCVKHPNYIPTNVSHFPVGHIMTTNAVCVKLSDNVFDAFKLCLNMKLSGIGVVDEKGNLQANLSVSMLKFLTPENFYVLLRSSVKKFLEETGGMLSRLPKTLNYSATIDTAIKSMHNNHVHRIYVVDHNNKPVGVVSVSDIVKLIAKDYNQRK